MLKAIVAFSLRFRGIVIALACLAFGYGVYSAINAKLGVFPEFAPPQTMIQTEAPGLAPEQVEALITQPIENVLLGLNDVAVIRSQSIQGLSAITVFFREGTDIYRDRQLVSERLLEVASQMPAGVSAPVMAPLTPAAAWFLTVGLTSKKLQPMDLWSFAYWTMRPRLLAVPGVAKVEIYGGGVRQLQIQVQPRRLLAYGLSISQVLAAARRATGVSGAGLVENTRAVGQRSVGAARWHQRAAARCGAGRVGAAATHRRRCDPGYTRSDPDSRSPVRCEHSRGHA